MNHEHPCHHCGKDQRIFAECCEKYVTEETQRLNLKDCEERRAIAYCKSLGIRAYSNDISCTAVYDALTRKK